MSTEVVARAAKSHRLRVCCQKGSELEMKTLLLVWIIIAALPGMCIAASEDDPLVTAAEDRFDRQWAFDQTVEPEGFPHGFIRNLAVSVDHGLLFADQQQYAGHILETGRHPYHNGLFVSRDQGQSWERTLLWNAWSMAVDDHRGVVYVFSITGDMLVSEDLGASWKAVDSGLPQRSSRTLGSVVTRITVDPATGRLYGRVGMEVHSVYVMDCPESVWYSIADGLPEGFSADDVCFSPEEQAVYTVNGSIGFIRLSPQEPAVTGLYRGIRTEDGYTWEKEQGLPEHPDFTASVRRVVIEPHTGIPYACTIDGVYARIDGLWELELQARLVEKLVFEDTGADHAPRAMAWSMDGLHVREDNEWRHVENTPWHPDARLGDMCFYAETMYVGTLDGLWTSRDGGQTWSRTYIPDAGEQ